MQPVAIHIAKAGKLFTLFCSLAMALMLSSGCGDQAKSRPSATLSKPDQTDQENRPAAATSRTDETRHLTAAAVAPSTADKRQTSGAPNDAGIGGSDSYRIASGIWVSDSQDPGKALAFPEEVSIRCVREEQICHVSTVQLIQVENGTSGRITIYPPDNEDYAVKSWDERSLLASYSITIPISTEHCHESILAMNFQSKTVTLTDIPNHEKGCEAITETNSYRLARGEYYIDVKPGQTIKPTN